MCVHARMRLISHLKAAGAKDAGPSLIPMPGETPAWPTEGSILLYRKSVISSDPRDGERRVGADRQPKERPSQPE